MYLLRKLVHSRRKGVVSNRLPSIRHCPHVIIEGVTPTPERRCGHNLRHIHTPTFLLIAIEAVNDQDDVMK